MAKVRQQALTLAEDPDTTLAVREHALSIAGHGGGTGGEGKEGVLGQPQVIEPGGHFSCNRHHVVARGASFREVFR